MKTTLEPTTAEAMSALAQALLATCLDSLSPQGRAQEREAWTYAVLGYVQREPPRRIPPPGH